MNNQLVTLEWMVTTLSDKNACVSAFGWPRMNFDQYYAEVNYKYTVDNGH